MEKVEIENVWKECENIVFGRRGKKWHMEKLISDIQKLPSGKIFELDLQSFKEVYGSDLSNITEKELKKQIRRVLRRTSEKIEIKFAIHGNTIYIQKLTK